MGNTETIGWIAVASMLPWDDIFDDLMMTAELAAYLGREGFILIREQGDKAIGFLKPKFKNIKNKRF